MNAEGALDTDVVVASLQRPESLARCLDALAQQSHPARRIVVVAHSDDHETQRCVRLGAWQSVELVLVHEPGVVAALTAGVAATTAPIVAFTDDDATPHSDWLHRLAAPFAHAAVGAVGGRDVIEGQTEPRTERVGRYRWWGKLDGNHHLGRGPERDVVVLKGVNMAVRADLLALPTSGTLHGAGAQRDWEVLTCARVLRCGSRVVYDPAIEVDHHCAPRKLGPARGELTTANVNDAAFNAIVASSMLTPWMLAPRLCYALCIGHRDAPGLARTLAAIIRREPGIAARLRPSFAGSLHGAWSTLANTLGRQRRRSFVTATELRNARTAS